jgi:hypothetical protein
VSSDSNGKQGDFNHVEGINNAVHFFLTKIRFMYIFNKEFSKHEERTTLILIDNPGHSRKHPHGAPSTYSQRFTLILQPLQGGSLVQSINQPTCRLAIEVVVGGGLGFIHWGLDEGSSKLR